MWPYMMGGFGNGHDWTGSVFMVLFWGLLCLLLIFAIVAGVMLLMQAFPGIGADQHNVRRLDGDVRARPDGDPDRGCPMDEMTVEQVDRTPTHPGEILREEVLPALDINPLIR